MNENRRLLLVLLFLGGGLAVFMYLNSKQKAQAGQQAEDDGSGLAAQQARYYGVPPTTGIGGNAPTTAYLSGFAQGQVGNFSNYDNVYSNQQLQFPLPMNG